MMKQLNAIKNQNRKKKKEYQKAEKVHNERRDQKS